MAALLADTDAGSKEQLEILKEQLAALAAQAIIDDCPPKDKTPSLSDGMHGSGSSHMASSHSAGTSTTTDPPSLESPLTFLRQAFPDVSFESLQDALLRTGYTEPLNMQRIVEDLLSQELLAVFKGENLESPVTVEKEWPGVAKKQSMKGKKAVKARPVPLIDIRQRQHQSSPRASASPTTAQGDTDPWSHLASLAAYLSNLLPPHTENEFLSAFHSPQHATPYDALMSFLSSIKPGKREEVAVDNDLITLMTLCVGDDQEDSFDAILGRKCVLATEGRIEDALDLFKLVQDMEFSGPIVHLPAPTLSACRSDPLTAKSPTSPTRGKSKASITINQATTTQVMQRGTFAQAAADSWTSVERRKLTAVQPHPYASFMPSHQHKGGPKVIARETPEKSAEAANQVHRHRAVEESWQIRRAEVIVILGSLEPLTRRHCRLCERLQSTGKRVVMVTEDRWRLITPKRQESALVKVGRQP